MNRPPPKTVRRRFFIELGHAIHLTWPVLSAILAIQVALGLLIGFVEGWSIGDAVYFTFVTGLTIGYGDVVPRQALGRALAVGIGICGLFLTGLIAGIAVYAMRRSQPVRALTLRLRHHWYLVTGTSAYGCPKNAPAVRLDFLHLKPDGSKFH